MQKFSKNWKQGAQEPRGGEALTLERGMGMCRGHDSLFSGQAPLPSLPIYRQCAALETPFSIFRKFLHFQPCFGQNSSSLDPIFSKFSFPRPPFLKENPLPRPYIFETRVAHIHPVSHSHAWYPGGGGGTDLERGYGDVRPWRPPFHASPAARKGPISSKRVSSQDPLLRTFGNFSLNSLNFHPNFSSQAPKFGNFQLTSPQIRKISAHKPPDLEIFRSQAPLFKGKCQFASPTLRKSGLHTPTWKKVECPPPGAWYMYSNCIDIRLIMISPLSI